jgi:hypothetical protein
MEKRGLNFWDVLAWKVLAGIFLWLILKVLGIINTPLLLEYAPYFGAVYLIGWQIHKLDSVADDVKELKRFKDPTINEVHKIKENCASNHK